MSDGFADTVIELRGMTPRSTIDVIDAVSAARRMSRIDLVNEVLGEFAEQKRREATAILRVVEPRDRQR